MKKVFYILFTIVPIFSCFTLFAQTQEEQIDLAELYELRNEFPKAISIYENILLTADRTSQYTYWLALSRLYLKNNQPKDALKYQTKVQGFKRSKENILQFAKILKYNGNYDQAKKQFERVKRNFPEDSISSLYIASCDSSLAWFKNPNPGYNVYEASAFNSKAKDFAPFPVGNKIVFSTTRKDNASKGEENKHLHTYDLFSSTIDIETTYENTPRPGLFLDVNTKEHEAMASFTSDGNKVYFTKTIKGKVTNGVQQEILNIFYSEKKAGKWSAPINQFPFNSLLHSTGHPCINPAGDVLIYMSDEKGGYGMADLFVSKLENGVWTPGENLGEIINTAGNELFPNFIGDTLFFSSDGHLGMGRLDIFMSIYDRNTNEWSTPINLKFPVNTVYDDFGLCPFGTTEQGFFCSNRPKGTGDDDIYIYVKNKTDRMYARGNLISFEKNKFFGNIDAKVIQSKDSSIQLNPNGTMVQLIAQNETKYEVQFFKDELIENSAKFSLPVDPKTLMYLEIMTNSKPVQLIGMIEKNNISYGKKRIYVLKNSIPIDSLFSDLNGKFTYLIPATKAYTFVTFTDEGQKEFQSAKYSTVFVNVTDKKSKAVLKDTEIKISLDGVFYQTNTTDSLGNTFFKVRAGQEISLYFFKEGFFEKDTSIIHKPTLIQSKISIFSHLEEKPKMKLAGILTYQGKPIENALIDVFQGGKRVTQIKTDASGSYSIPVFNNEDYNLVINKSGLYTMDTVVSVKKTAESDTIIQMDKVGMNDIQIGKDVTLSNIYFDYNSFVINAATQLSLEKLIEFLQINPKAIVEVTSHTDARGEEKYNLLLSIKRAEAIKKHLIAKGIPSSKILSKGFGESQLLIKDAQTDAEHKKNRRTQFKVVEYLDYSTLEDPDLTKASSRIYLVHVDSESDFVTKEKYILDPENPIKTCLDKDNTIKYFFGPMNSEIKAQKLLEIAENKGYNDSYIQVFDNGKERAYEIE